MSALVEHDVDLGREHTCTVRLERADPRDPGLVDDLVEIDLQTYVEATFSRYTAAALLHAGEVFLLKADDATIGACLCVRRWDRPDEVQLVSVGLLAGWRGQGLGQRFLVWVLAALAAEGVSAVKLLVGRGNVRALRAYREVGFEVMGEAATAVVEDDAQLELVARLDAVVDAAVDPAVDTAADAVV